MKRAKSNKIDIVTLTIINNALVNICREMGTAMMRTSYSPIFNEALDFSCVIFTPRGEMIGQAEFCPTMIGSAQYAVKWTIEELGLDSFEPGDVVIHNDPYRGQCHMPEHMVLKPVFFGKKLRFFVANIAHWAKSAAWLQDLLRPTRPRSIRKACGSRQSRSCAGVSM